MITKAGKICSVGQQSGDLGRASGPDEVWRHLLEHSFFLWEAGLILFSPSID